jgi:hypothetical protein
MSTCSEFMIGQRATVGIFVNNRGIARKHDCLTTGARTTPAEHVQTAQSMAGRTQRVQSVSMQQCTEQAK